MKSSDSFSFSRSDLACERKPVDSARENTLKTRRTVEGFDVTELIISDDDSYPSGRYVTIDIGKIWLDSDERMESCERALASEITGYIRNLSEEKDISKMCIMAVGLGNRFITADALGPLTVDKLTVTRHMMGQGSVFDSMGCSRLCAVQPGVLGQTGIESAAIIKGAADEVRPDIIVAVDALAARSTARLSTTIQLSDVGISPGSGIGNRRTAINKETVGCPVIAIGVPTVVDSSTLVWDALGMAGIENINPALADILENGKNFFVSPKESDITVDEISSLIANAISSIAGL